MTPARPWGSLPSGAGQQFARSLGKVVERSDERRGHIARYHADVLPFLDRLGAALGHPDELRRSLDDPEVLLSCERSPDGLGGKYMLAVVRVGEEWSFILTAHLARTIRTRVPL